VTEEDKTHKQQYTLFIDGQVHHTDQQSVTGAYIKQLGGIPAAYQLFLEEEGDTADRAISDQDGISLEHGKPKHFFAVPPATFGA
jgi:hypothetical protein